jgi:DNA-binding transcriptional regulator LsrR (DeoR family)
MNNQKKRTQLQRTVQAFQEEPKTRMQVAKEIGIDRANVCWYIHDLRMRNNIAVIKVDHCPITNHRAEFLSKTDSNLIEEKKEKEPTLF